MLNRNYTQRLPEYFTLTCLTLVSAISMNHSPPLCGPLGFRCLDASTFQLCGRTGIERSTGLQNIDEFGATESRKCPRNTECDVRSVSFCTPRNRSETNIPIMYTETQSGVPMKKTADEYKKTHLGLEPRSYNACKRGSTGLPCDSQRRRQKVDNNYENVNKLNLADENKYEKVMKHTRSLIYDQDRSSKSIANTMNKGTSIRNTYPDWFKAATRYDTKVKQVPDLISHRCLAFVCERCGYFADPQNNNKYFRCELKSNGKGFIQRHRSCKSGMIYDGNLNKCVDLKKQQKDEMNLHIKQLPGTKNCTSETNYKTVTSCRITSAKQKPEQDNTTASSIANKIKMISAKCQVSTAKPFSDEGQLRVNKTPSSNAKCVMCQPEFFYNETLDQCQEIIPIIQIPTHRTAIQQQDTTTHSSTVSELVLYDYDLDEDIVPTNMTEGDYHDDALAYLDTEISDIINTFIAEIGIQDIQPSNAENDLNNPSYQLESLNDDNTQLPVIPNMENNLQVERLSNPTNKKSYYLCYRPNDGVGFIEMPFDCPENLYFNDIEKKCLP